MWQARRLLLRRQVQPRKARLVVLRLAGGLSVLLLTVRDWVVDGRDARLRVGPKDGHLGGNWLVRVRVVVDHADLRGGRARGKSALLASHRGDARPGRWPAVCGASRRRQRRHALRVRLGQLLCRGCARTRRRPCSAGSLGGGGELWQQRHARAGPARRRLSLRRLVLRVELLLLLDVHAAEALLLGRLRWDLLLGRRRNGGRRVALRWLGEWVLRAARGAPAHAVCRVHRHRWQRARARRVGGRLGGGGHVVARRRQMLCEIVEAVRHLDGLDEVDRGRR
mmetsp:Transcript_11640/g.34418  ORF Transcript_11640/g.34418 Transcript_11640/m.34418 type:complete len:281 (-) Transcript_11640:930-1772(-)